MSVLTASPPRQQHHQDTLASSRSQGVDMAGGEGAANEVSNRAGRSGSVNSSLGSAGGGGGGSGGILANAHEAPKRSANQSAFRSALKAAFVPQQPGKQFKTGGKPLGKTFHRKEPLPQSHEGGEILKVDPRGPNAPCGDGVVLSSPEEVDENSETKEDVAESTASPSQKQESSFSDLLSPSSATGADRRNRSATESTAQSELSTDSRGNPCRIKFAPLPTSGRLKRANSITIGVAARSQLLHSQGAGRSLNGSAQLWQQQQQVQQQQQQQQVQRQGQRPDSSGSRHSGIQPPEQVDIADEIRKGALKAWEKVRRGSSASRTSEVGAEAARRIEAEGATATGEKTPKRAQTPQRDEDGAVEEEEDGTQTPSRKGMARRVSTGAFTGHASFSQMEEKRKRGDVRREDERENEATRFIEMLGSTGAGKEAYHGAGVQRKAGGNAKAVNVVLVNGKGRAGGDGGAEDEGDGNEDGDDDEEEREAEALADQALKGHSEKAMKAGGVEKMEKKRP